MSAEDELNKIEAALRGDVTKAQTWFAANKKWVYIGVAVVGLLLLWHYL